MDRNNLALEFFSISKQGRKRYMILCSIMLLIMLLACGGSGTPKPPIAPPLIVERDLVGIWEGYYFSSPRGAEVIVFKADGTYLQFYQDADGYFYDGQGNWRVEKTSSGLQRVQLDGGLWFPGGANIAKLRGTEPGYPDQPHAFWDSDTLDTVEMTTGLILMIGTGENPKGFTLGHYAYDFESGMEALRPPIR